MFYTYLHRRVDTNEVFYIGKGSGKRAWRHGSRSRGWHRVVKAARGHTVKVLAQWCTEEEAFEHERLLISCFRDLGAPLCNLTCGGDGYTHTPEARAKISEAKKGRPLTAAHVAALTGLVRSPEARENMRRGQLGKRKGVPLTAAHKAAIAASRLGKPHPHHRKGI